MLSLKNLARKGLTFMAVYLCQKRDIYAAA